MMCVVSAVGDNWKDQFPYRYPDWTIPKIPYSPNEIQIPPNEIQIPPQVTKEEFEALKKEVQELRTLLLAAKKFDEATGQPNCEMDEKVNLIKQVAKLVGVDMKDVFGES